MGLNFYGGFYRTPGDGGPVVGHEALAILDAARPPLAWDEDAAEHLGKVGLFSVEVTPTFLSKSHPLFFWGNIKPLGSWPSWTPHGRR